MGPIWGSHLGPIYYQLSGIPGENYISDDENHGESIAAVPGGTPCISSPEGNINAVPTASTDKQCSQRQRDIN
ncbi:hypothetical protein HUJ04_001499 [Dendroctonus ponderosae]|nr:hypothetical protein HUJ04_001499 [Dendroctonus ponderosae]